MAADDFWLECVDASRQSLEGSLEVMWPVRFEDGLPVRELPSFKGQRNFTGWYWSATRSAHVGYESWLERDHVMRLDFDSQVTAVVSQPFRLSWRGPGDGRRVRHTPDYFVRRSDGSGLVVDVRPDERIPEEDAAKFAATAAACARVGWDFERVGELDPVYGANLRWLAGYRHPRVLRSIDADALLKVFAQERGLLDGARAVGDPIAVLPVLYHLLWRQDLVTDLHGGLLSAATRVGPAAKCWTGVRRDALASARAVGG